MAKIRTILLVEDNLKDIELTLEAMTENNLANDIIVARDGVEALEYLHCQEKFKLRKAGNPALVLLDIKMPRMDGIEVLRNIRSDTMLKRIPVVVLTSSNEEKDLINTYDLGVNAYVVKPVDFTQFIEAVKQIGSFWAVLNELAPERSS
ncbi:MAG: response regulator [Prolixibacteraceae bacterium]|jgi:CheY-like chemotaxis protein|nr:response regulator [Prolixibacteraceae bacterium]